MAYWGEINFMDAFSPNMFQLICFYDHSMVVIISIIAFLFMFMLDISFNKVLNMGLLEGQIIEMIWTILPMFLLVFIAIPSLRLLYLMEENFFDDFSLKVTGHQWFWSYSYGDISGDDEKDCPLAQNYFQILAESDFSECYRLLDTDGCFFVPNFTSVRVLVTSADVIHCWSIPSMGVKTDAVPGRLNQVNLHSTDIGLFFGQCAEICGTYHSFMPIKMKILNWNEFLVWLSELDIIEV